jgi:hypothetical protein
MESTKVTQPKNNFSTILKNSEKSKKHTERTFGLLKDKGSFYMCKDFQMTDEDLQIKRFKKYE